VQEMKDWKNGASSRYEAVFDEIQQLCTTFKA
jgi:hypothetical protein